MGYLMILRKSCTQWIIYFRILFCHNQNMILLLAAFLSENPSDRLPMSLSVSDTNSLNKSNTFSEIFLRLDLLLNPQYTRILSTSLFIFTTYSLLFLFLINPEECIYIYFNTIWRRLTFSSTIASHILMFYQNLVFLVILILDYPN